MRAVVGRVALLVGVFALVAAAIAMFWGRDAGRRIPISTESFTRLSGTAAGALAKSDTPVPVTYVIHTQTDPNASTGTVIAMQQVGCMAATADFCIDAQGNFLLASTDPAVVSINTYKFALDRHTGLPVKDQARYIKDTSAIMPYEGIVAKFPFNTEKKTYQFWDGTLQKSVDATFSGTKTIGGVKTLRFDVDVPSTPAEVADGVQGTYEGSQTLWVEPRTGAYIDQAVRQKITLDDGTVVLDADLRYTAQTVKANASDAKGNVRSLWLIDVLARWIGLGVGIVLIALAIVLLRRPRAGSPGERPRTLTHA